MTSNYKKKQHRRKNKKKREQRSHAVKSESPSSAYLSPTSPQPDRSPTKKETSSPFSSAPDSSFYGVDSNQPTLTGSPLSENTALNYSTIGPLSLSKIYSPEAAKVVWSPEQTTELRELLEYGEEKKWEYLSCRLSENIKEYYSPAECKSMYEYLFNVSHDQGCLSSSIMYFIHYDGINSFKGLELKESLMDLADPFAEGKRKSSLNALREHSQNEKALR